MNKQFEYRGFNFNIFVELNTKKDIDGICWHTFTVTCKEIDEYYINDVIKENHITIYVIDIERYARKYIDERLDGTPSIEQKLIKLGFK